MTLDHQGLGVSSQSFVFDVDDLLFHGLDVNVVATLPEGSARVELAARFESPLDPLAVGVLRAVPFAIDVRAVYAGKTQTKHLVRAADLVLEHGHGMLASLPIDASLPLTAPKWPAVPVMLEIGSVVPALPPLEPAW